MEGRYGSQPSARLGSHHWEFRFTAGAVRVFRYRDGANEARVAAVGYGLSPWLAMRYEFSALPWWQLGRRLVFITLTLPHPWRRLVPDAKALHRKRMALYSAWLRQWGATPVGVWGLEFQPRAWAKPSERAAPHLHFYLALPDAVAEEEFEGLQRRLWRRLALEKDLGPKRARAQVGAPRGEFCDWLVTTWTRIVCGPNEQRRLIMDVRPVFWSERAYREAPQERVAEYFWRESGKAAQKQPPIAFGQAKLWGTWKGKGKWFVPVEERRVVPGRVGLRIGSALAHARDVRLGRRHVVRADEVWKSRGRARAAWVFPDGTWASSERRRARSRGRRLLKANLGSGAGAVLFVSEADVLAERLHAWAQQVVDARAVQEWDAVVDAFLFDGWGRPGDLDREAS